jgi:hypothetical protein
VEKSLTLREYALMQIKIGESENRDFSGQEIWSNADRPKTAMLVELSTPYFFLWALEGAACESRLMLI